MINETALAHFQPLAEGFIKPLYGNYSFGNIPDTIEFLLTGNRHGPVLSADCLGGSYPAPRKVVLLFVDSFGWQHWQQHAGRFRTTMRVMEQGTLTPISTLFPSTTAASVSTMNLGVLPAAHSLYEWNIYVPAYGETIQSLAFAPLGPYASDSCLRKGYDPAALLTARETVHHRLQRHGVRSLQFAHRSYADSAYNSIACAGAEVTKHGTLAEALVQLKEAISQVDGKALLSFYWAGIDTIAHIYGPGTPYHAAEIASFWHTFDEVMRDVASPDTLYLFTADHGHVYADRDETFYLNERLPQISAALAMSPTRTFIYPNGSPRDVFLHVRPNRLEWTLDALRRKLDGIALVLTVNEALAEGLFGPEPIHAELRRRLGDILILPRAGHFVWWREKGKMTNRYYGHHGGLTPEEAITVIGVVDTL